MSQNTKKKLANAINIHKKMSRVKKTCNIFHR